MYRLCSQERLERSRGSLSAWGLACIVLASASYACSQEHKNFILDEQSSNEPAPFTESLLPHLEGSQLTLYASQSWKLTREKGSSLIHVFHSNGRGRWQENPLLNTLRSKIHPMAAVEGPGGLYLVVYDLEANIPSGRSLKPQEAGLDLYRFSSKANEPIRLASGLPLGGIDTHVSSVAVGKDIYLTGETVIAVDGNSGIVTPLGGPPEGYELIESAISPRGHQTALLSRRKEKFSSDAHPSDYILSLAGADAPTTVAWLSRYRGIPYHLTWRAERPSLRFAREPQDFLRLLDAEFRRMPFGGAMDFGANNQEGRIVWSSVYYLNALLTLASPAVVELTPIQRTCVLNRVDAECDALLDLLSSPLPGLTVRRYSLNREPLLFALHLGRVARLLERARSLNHHISWGPSRKQLLSSLENRMEHLSGTVETFGTLKTKGRNVETLQYKLGAPFWADGANVPYNFLSGYSSGLLALEHRPDLWKRAAILMTPLQEEEFGAPILPDTWRYWGGLGDKGWEAKDAPSRHTPTWPGNRGAPAHTTYRSMDASALIALKRRSPDAVAPNLIEHFRHLTASGSLLPWVNEELCLMPSGTVALQPAVTRYFARSASPWELQGQVWAIAQCMRQASQETERRN